MPVCSFQNGVYGSRLVSTDYTFQENNAMVEASFSLISTKNRLMRNSVERYERIHATYVHPNYLKLDPNYLKLDLDFVRTPSSSIPSFAKTLCRFPTKALRRVHAASRDLVPHPHRILPNVIPMMTPTPAPTTRMVRAALQLQTMFLSIEAHLPFIKCTPFQKIFITFTPFQMLLFLSARSPCR